MDLKLRRKIVCLHESAHALLLWHQGMQLENVSILLDETGYWGRATTKFGAEACEVLPVEQTAARIKSYMAGRAAVDLFYPEQNGGYGADMKKILMDLSADQEWYRMVRWLESHSPCDIDVFYEEFKAPVIQILKSRAGNRALLALAKRLDRAGTLSGAAAVEILEKFWGKPLPPKALPVERHAGIMKKYPETLDDLKKALRLHTELMMRYVNHIRGGENQTANEKLDGIHMDLLMFRILHLDQ